ncbi:hypothetical protein [Herbidospora yilanensis]|uniref:hypothetical protein n=1 Tax=Herbidospora yilanensis TaxID=354426 RepID=UPI000783D3A6|nr:hypothetical protein [Herbidospora yilanensis]
MIVLGKAARLRVTQVLGGRRWHVANHRTIREVEQHVDLADLVEVIAFPAGPVAGLADATSKDLAGLRAPRG